MILGPLFHWSPADRQDQILTEGLRPNQSNTVASGPLAHVCLGPDPATAWSLSGGMEWAEVDVWDLWQVALADTDPVRVRPDFGPRLLEIKVLGPIPPDRLWWCGRRDR